MRFGKSRSSRLHLLTTSMFAAFALASPALAQEAAAPAQTQEEEEIVVTGIRGSLQRAIDIKRNADGVVDAISQEDIGKMPDTNLAESLQRIPGVSINRVNGEGSEVTVRGFGAGFNLVTLNGRTMPTANVAIVGGDQSVDFNIATGRSFDFSNIASEGVSGLEVYKTGRAAIPSGGIGATINITTLRPIDNPGIRASASAKGLYDMGNEYGEDITPEVAGLFSWTDPNEMFGVALFGSYAERDGSARSATVNEWNIIHAGDFASRMSPGGTVTGLPSDPTHLVAFPNDSRYHFSATHRERINGQLTVQFRPVDSLTFTGDITYANNKTEEQRTDQTNWFAQGFDEVIFEENAPVATAVFLQQDISGAKDIGYEQQFRAAEDTLESYGFNAEWQASDNLAFTLDAHTSKAESVPDNPMGASSTLISFGAEVVTAHSVDFRSGFPVQDWSFNDSIGGDGSGVLDAGDLGSAIARTNVSSQTHDVDEIRLDGRWDIDERSRFDFGAGYRSGKMVQDRIQTQQTLGNWSIDHPGDVELLAGGLVEEYCLSCLFNDFSPGDADVAFRANAVDLYQTLSAAYLTDPFGDGLDHAVNVSGFDHNEVEETIFSVYAQLSLEGELLSRPARLVGGVRYEETEVTSTALVAPVTAINWLADNDFTRAVNSDPAAGVVRSGSGKYTNLLPSIDLSLDVTDDVVARVSFSKTLARPDFGALFVSETANAPPRATFFGGIPTGDTGNPDLLPLESENFDVSFEWYYGDASYLSIGAYHKTVKNFTGTAQETRNLFDLRDPTSGSSPGVAAALAQLNLLSAEINEENLFTMTALLANAATRYESAPGAGDGTPGDAVAEFTSHLQPNGTIDFAFNNAILSAYDIIANSGDPFYNFEVRFPINNREAQIYGLEISFAHFFGDSGFGVAGSLTTVDGDVGIDVAADPSVDQFALIGLSDTYNITGIYEKYGVSARLTYNWRDEFLAQTNRGGGNRNPVFVEAFGQLDLNVGYEFTPNFMVTFEGINLTEEGVRTFARDDSQLYFAQELDARYLFGARYRY